MNYYNENDPKAAAWLRELIKANLIPQGHVDERSIADVSPEDLSGFTQCHFFAGIGGWSYALQLAGWPEDVPVWTGSCPCQRYSRAARGRHNAPDLWPEFRRVIATVRPIAVFGEQVSAARHWLEGVRDDMETMGYAFGATSLPACCVYKDHIRERVYFVGHAHGHSKPILQINEKTPWMQRNNSNSKRMVPEDGLPGRVALMRGFGNAIVPELASEFIQAYLETQWTHSN